MKQTVLVIEDEQAIRRGLVDGLLHAGYRVHEAADGESGLSIATTASIDLILLDVMLPKLNGFEMLKALRVDQPLLPVILLTARGDEADRVEGFRRGADDYVVKPFSVAELHARISAVLRRSRHQATHQAAIKLGQMTIDLNRQSVLIDEQSVAELSGQETALLTKLADHQDRAVTREELLEDVWGVELSGAETRAVDMLIKRLRTKLQTVASERSRVPIEPNSLPSIVGPSGGFMTHRSPWKIWLLFGVLALIAFTAMSVVQRRLQTLHHESQQALNDERWEQAISLSLWRMEAKATQIFRDLAAADTAPSEALAMKVAWIQGTLKPSSTDTVALNQQDAYAGFGNTDYGQQAETTPQQAVSKPGKTKGGYDNYLDTQNRAGLNTNQYGLQQQTQAPTQQIRIDPTQATSIYPTSLIIERVDGQLICQQLHAPPETPDVDLSLAPWRTPRFLLDEQAISDSLLAACKDLLPNAALLPVAHETDAPLDRQLASLPFAIDPGGRTARYQDGGNEAIWATNFFSGIALITALGLMTLLISVLIRISQQRADFVAAVTHEMRTPLTTFQMYTEMLRGGMVKPEAKADYLNTLHSESIRLNRLIENVLSFARLEKSTKDANAQDALQTTVGALIDSTAPRFEEQVNRAGGQWRVHADENTRQAVVLLRPQTFDQILSNLVDNACKYAVGEKTPEVCLSVDLENNQACFAISDQGPGLTPAEAKRVFRAFHRTQKQRQSATPGIGLGLAISRRLAQSADGDLIYQTVDGSAHFVLCVPRL